MNGDLMIAESHQHHFEERPVFAGCGVIREGANETNM